MAKDIIHDAVKNALIKDGWTITADPFRFKFEELKLAVDLSLERQISAERSGHHIVVEIKSFLGRSLVRDFQQAMGQYLMYYAFLEQIAPQYEVYLAISQFSYNRFFQKKAIRFLLKRYQIALLIVNLEQEEIIQWLR
ncbi:MAG: XisH protein [Planctomycetes bacterium]|nr:XisH protein [Planctomycetota bacterium]